MSCPPGDEATGSSPCEGCGLCCNGVLYGRARIAPGEEGRIKDAGLEQLEVDRSKYFRLPCHFERDGLCSIYDDRFTICHSFRCALLRRFDSRDVSLADARSTVAEAKRLLRAVAESDPAAFLAGNRQDLRVDLADQMRASDGPGKRDVGVRLVNLVALDAYLDQFFRNRKGQSERESVDRDSFG